MRNFLASFIILCFQYNSFCFASEINSFQKFNQTQSFTKNNYNILYAGISYDKQKEQFEDELVAKYSDKSLQIPQININYINDPLVDNITFLSKNPKSCISPNNSLIEDDFVKSHLVKFANVSYHKKIYNFENLNHTIVKICAKNFVSTKFLKSEGQIIEFITTEDVIQNKKVIIPKNSVITARVETISPNMSRGIPADLIIGNFKYGNINLEGEISKTGASRIYWIIPLAFIANTLFYGSGYILWIIRGGHAKLKPNQIYEIAMPDVI